MTAMDFNGFQQSVIKVLLKYGLSALSEEVSVRYVHFPDGVQPKYVWTWLDVRAEMQPCLLKKAGHLSIVEADETLNRFRIMLTLFQDDFNRPWVEKKRKKKKAKSVKKPEDGRSKTLSWSIREDVLKWPCANFVKT